MAAVGHANRRNGVVTLRVGRSDGARVASLGVKKSEASATSNDLITRRINRQDSLHLLGKIVHCVHCVWNVFHRVENCRGGYHRRRIRDKKVVNDAELCQETS